MKKVLSIFMSLVMLLSITAGLDLTVNAETLTGSCGENVTYTLDTESGLLTISGTGDMYNYKLEYDSFLDKWFCDAPWYSNNISIQKIIISEGVTSIGDFAFYEFVKLNNVSIPNGVTYIGYKAFYFCSNLANITLPNSVIEIGQEAFSHCAKLINFVIPDSVTSVGIALFEDCYNLSEITIGNNIPSIGDYTFENCYNLTNIVIPSSVEYISAHAFANSNLKTIFIPSNVHDITGNAFEGCKNLESINVDIDNKDYSSYNGVLFDKYKRYLKMYPIGNKNLSYIIPNDVVRIESGAFKGCKNLSKIFIPKTINRIEMVAFYGLDNLTDVYYEGNRDYWLQISVDTYNEMLLNANIHFNAKTCDLNGHIFDNNGNCSVCGLINPDYIATKPAKVQLPTQPTKATTKEQTTSGVKKIDGVWVNKKYKKPSISKLTKAKKSFKVVWKKVSGVSGYQIQYATDKKFKKNKKTVTVKGNKSKKPSKTIKKLKAKKKYYVRVRTYKTVKVNGKATKVYSSWSKAKSVKTK